VTSTVTLAPTSVPTKPPATATRIEPTATVTSTPTETPTAVPEPIDEEDLSEALLTISDMPTGWTTSPPDEEEESADEGETFTTVCNVELPRRSLTQVKAEFQKSQLGPFLQHTITAYPPGEAELFLEDFIDAANSCTEWTTAEDDQQFTWRLAPLSFPNLGDETFAIRTSTELELLGLMEIDTIYIREADVIINIAHMAIGISGIDSEQTEVFARLAIEKLTN
jgi:hypothetical protein